jgi:DNA-binding CsgD family transcriptional regulator
VDDAELVDLIYEGGANPERWVDALDALALRAGAVGGILFAVRETESRWVATEGIREIAHRFVNEGWTHRNPRASAALRLKHAGFVDDHDLLTEAEIESSALYTEFLRPCNAGWCVGTLVMPTNGDSIVLSLERAFDKGPVPADVKLALDPLRPHIARSVMLAGRLGMERAAGMTGALGLIGLPAAILTSSGRVVAANAELETGPYVSSLASERLALADPVANIQFRSALARGAHGLNGSVGCVSFPLSGSEGVSPTVAHLLPLVRSGRDIFSQGDAILILSELGRSGTPGPAVLEALFDLTPAEARIARGIAHGLTSEEIARDMRIQVATVRSHLKKIFVKTGVDRQVALSRLLCGLPLVSP